MRMLSVYFLVLKMAVKNPAGKEQYWKRRSGEKPAMNRPSGAKIAGKSRMGKDQQGEDRSPIFCLYVFRNICLYIHMITKTKFVSVHPNFAHLILPWYTLYMSQKVALKFLKIKTRGLTSHCIQPRILVNVLQWLGRNSGTYGQCIHQYTKS